MRPSNTEEFVSTQLHTFADASQRGYGAVTYLRFEDSKGNIHCSFVIAKSRVAPLKETTTTIGIISGSCGDQARQNGTRGK